MFINSSKNRTNIFLQAASLQKTAFQAEAVFVKQRRLAAKFLGQIARERIAVLFGHPHHAHTGVGGDLLQKGGVGLLQYAQDGDGAVERGQNSGAKALRGAFVRAQLIHDPVSYTHLVL